MKHNLNVRPSNYVPRYLSKSKLVEELCPHKKSAHQCFKTALFIIAKNWKQPRCSPVGEWLDILWYIHTVEYYITIKRNELPGYEKIHGGILNAYCQVKESNLKRLHNV